MTIYHTTRLNGREHRWPVDVAAAAGAMAWVARAPQVLERDLQGMAEYFPHWILAGSKAGRPSCCPDCGRPHVPTRGAMRCAGCGDETDADGLTWLGHIPSLARTEAPFRRRQQKLRRAGFAEVTAAGATYLLVPLTVSYPSEWPNVQPAVRYPQPWLKALNLPRGSGSHHLIRDGRACLFGSNQWVAMPVHTVLQQRVVNHVASLLKVAAGKKPGEAFIGLGHHTTGLDGR